MNIDTDVLDILKESTIDGNILKLPPTQLPRDLYTRVNKILTVAGGKWDKKTKGHVFPKDPREKLGLAVENGEIRDEKKEFQAFYTPEHIARDIVRIAGIKPGWLVLEPSAGSGQIAKAANNTAALVDCCEINTEIADDLIRFGFKTYVGDFLTCPVNPIYDAVVMNPPFAKGQDAKHVMHAFEFLKPDGVLVAIVSPSFQHNSTKIYKKFREFIDKYGGIEAELEEGTFKESGTKIRTCIIKLEKP